MRHSYPWYTRDWWLSDTRALLNLEQRGLYRELMDLMYDLGGKLPRDEKYLQSKCAVSLREWNRSWPVVKTRLIQVEDGYVKPKTSEVVERMDRFSEERRRSGQAGGNKKASNRVAELGQTGSEIVAIRSSSTVLSQPQLREHSDARDAQSAPEERAEPSPDSSENQPETREPAKSHQPSRVNTPDLASIGGATQFPEPSRQSDTPEIVVARSSAKSGAFGNSPHRLSQAPPADREERDRIVEEGWSYLIERYPNQSRVDSANRFWISECALAPDIPALRAYVKLVRDGLDYHLGPPLVAKWANDHGELQARFVPALDAFLGAPSLNGRNLPSKLYLDRPPKWQARDAPVPKGEAMWAEVEKILQADAAKREGWKKKREIA